MTPCILPLRDMQFVVHERLEAESVVAEMAARREIDAATLDGAAKEAGKFCAEVLQPLNEIGDREGCRMALQRLQPTARALCCISRALRDCNAVVNAPLQA